jgi:hypothetical protein
MVVISIFQRGVHGMFDALKNFITHQPTQREAFPGQVPNDAVGFSFERDKWTQLKRFPILGTAEGSFYAGERTVILPR